MLRRVIVYYVIAVVAGFGVYQLGDSLRISAANAEEYREPDPVYRVAPGVRLLDIDSEFMVTAIAYVGNGDTYAIERREGAGSPITLGSLPSYAQSRLMPARLVAVEEAEWLLCYGCPLDRFPQFEPQWVSEGGRYAVARRRR